MKKYKKAIFLILLLFLSLSCRDKRSEELLKYFTLIEFEERNIQIDKKKLKTNVYIGGVTVYEIEILNEKTGVESSYSELNYMPELSEDNVFNDFLKAVSYDPNIKKDNSFELDKSKHKKIEKIIKKYNNEKMYYNSEVESINFELTYGYITDDKIIAQNLYYIKKYKDNVYYESHDKSNLLVEELKKIVPIKYSEIDWNEILKNKKINLIYIKYETFHNNINLEELQKLNNELVKNFEKDNLKIVFDINLNDYE
ncbi:hypothetical protein [Oceanivirga salmonicida]|uniref:hypothetical protein n=1 Tax=Oceanivirga salmonicida TaxID=1769291 RepID=UPI0012E1D6F9|nr:hypothetical protein [Oceanivirga salmonicida]